VLKNVLGQETVFLWHKGRELRNVDCVVLPGGFSYGDYLRSGAIAKFSPIMPEVIEFAAQGGLVLGICNGFQILLEVGLLPGAMIRNKNLKFLCQYVHVRIENTLTPFTLAGKAGQVLKIPIAHFDGNYYAPPETLKELEARNQIVLRYSDEHGKLSPEANVNGSALSIAGLMNRAGNVMGLMPHPERASEALLGSVDGRVIFESLISSRPVSKKTERAKHDRP
jgi:phosphoribosylformylglycinamidine synthase